MLLKRWIVLLSIIISHQSTAQMLDSVITGAGQINNYLPIISDKNVAVVANQTSIVGQTHLVDLLLSKHVKVKKIFTPEHGFRGVAEAGENIESGKDKSTGLPIISLYGNHKKPTTDDLKGIDIVLFDLQDVGTRFYTYSSTLQYVMEACAENKKTRRF